MERGGGRGGRGNAIVANEHWFWRGREGKGRERGGDQESKGQLLAVHEYFMYPLRDSGMGWFYCHWGRLHLLFLV